MKSLESYTGKRVFVGLSGGVDSAVTAALLSKAGAQVIGVFIQGWYPPGLPCTWRDDRRDAMRAAAYLNLPFRTLDASVEYKKEVIDYLIDEYRAGRTPNPDIMCNRAVKFGAFERYAAGESADYIATGHYAQTDVGTDGAIQLSRGADEGKDQSYFLWNVPREALARTIFPLGSMRKDDVRTLAARFDLPNARKRDSQGICFLGSISVHDFLRAELGTESGKALDAEGSEVGVHDGAVLHTLGERVALTGALPGPWYVLSKDLRQNTITVAHERVLPKPAQAISLTQANWFGAKMPAGEVEAQYRYHGPRVLGVIQDGTRFVPNLPLAEPVAAGQSLVLYRGNECLGGAIIA